MANSKYGRSWVQIRKASKTQKELKHMQAQVTQLPKMLIEKHYYPAVVRIGWAARDYMRKIIEESETPTGRARAAAGGNGPGRIDSSTMYDALWANTRKSGSGFGYTVNVGWLNGTPGYAIFQEHGFSTPKGRVEGMRALERATQFVEDELRKLARGGRVYTRNTRWNS